MRERSLNPLPFRCGNLPPQQDDYFPFDVPAARAVYWWQQVLTWRLDVELDFGVFVWKFQLVMVRDANPLDELSQIDPRDGGDFLRTSTHGEPTRWRASIDESTDTDSRVAAFELHLCFQGPRPDLSDASPGALYRAHWSGHQLKQRRSSVDAGNIRPSFAFVVDARWEQGGAEYGITAANTITAAQIPIGGEITAKFDGLDFPLRFSDSALPASGSRLEITPLVHYAFANAAGQVVYTTDGGIVLNPLKARVP